MISVSELYKIGGGLNIEGGLPQIDLNKNKGEHAKIWANLVVVLDRPLIDNICFDFILNNNRYPLLENAIDNLNEHHFMTAFLLVICYYIKECHKFVNKEKVKITIHVHQDSICMPLVSLINSHLHRLIASLKTQSASEPHLNLDRVTIEYRTDIGSYISTAHNYDDTDVLISLSQCAGLDPKYIAGTLIVPDTFIPFDIDSQTVDITKKYSVSNHLMGILDDILKWELHENIVNYVNKNYVSDCPSKKFKAVLLSQSDFKVTNIIQVSKLWNPLDPHEKIITKFDDGMHSYYSHSY